MVAVISALIFGNSSSSLDQRMPSMVIRRPLTATLLLAVDTKRFTSWKKPARLKKSPSNCSSSGTVSSPTGDDTVPLELQFDGDFFNLAGFFHDVKRFVSTASNNVAVSGRLITIEGIRWSSDEELFPKIKAEITATIYLAPKTQGATAGATPTGPSTTTPTSTPDQSTP